MTVCKRKQNISADTQSRHESPTHWWWQVRHPHPHPPPSAARSNADLESGQSGQSGGVRQQGRRQDGDPGAAGLRQCDARIGE